ncbi:Retrovirus-related Pol polyprotein from transposon TNT 1-94 [Sesamum angolense]|uniref:Retrovirus-related Pol polyprotein from transposon TNT 1-94 n=1 Tax=Sesamum angolense TaxID=2727404 RepID=A0AAE1W0A0_9LAMI|nr:Retrovirus-related Pol polyprotein from transposon TNT 1-94 [Sesamum angolense]
MASSGCVMRHGHHKPYPVQSDGGVLFLGGSQDRGLIVDGSKNENGEETTLVARREKQQRKRFSNGCPMSATTISTDNVPILHRSARVPQPPESMPEGFMVVGEEQKVCHLQSWNIHFDEVIWGYDFVKNDFDHCVYKKVSGCYVLFLVLYVDDILLIGNDIKMLGDTKEWLSTQFSMKDLGDASS